MINKPIHQILYSATHLTPEDREALHLTVLCHPVSAVGSGYLPAGAMKLKQEFIRSKLVCVCVFIYHKKT